LTAKQQAAIERLLSGDTITAAAQTVGIGRRTLQRYFDIPEFKAALMAGSDTAIAVAAAKLASLADDAIDAINDVMSIPTTPGAAVRLRAADSLLSHVLKIREQTDILERLAAIEAELTDRG